MDEKDAKKKEDDKRIQAELLYKEVIIPGLLTVLITFCLMFFIALMIVGKGLGPMDRQYVAQCSGVFGASFGACCTFWLNDKNSKGPHNFLKLTVFPAILTALIAICLVFLILLMAESHSLQPPDRQFIAQCSGIFGVAFGSCCVFWFKGKKKK